MDGNFYRHGLYWGISIVFFITITHLLCSFGAFETSSFTPKSIEDLYYLGQNDNWLAIAVVSLIISVFAGIPIFTFLYHVYRPSASVIGNEPKHRIYRIIRLLSIVGVVAYGVIVGNTQSKGVVDQFMEPLVKGIQEGSEQPYSEKYIRKKIWAYPGVDPGLSIARDGATILIALGIFLIFAALVSLWRGFTDYIVHGSAFYTLRNYRKELRN